MSLLLKAPEGLEALLRSTDASNVTGVFFLLIAALFVTALVCYRRDKLRSLTHYTPNLLTSLGMLGTFVGIVIGLLHFDPDNIDDSISLLLGGLQTAFMTSLFGMTMTMVYKVLTGMPWLQPKQDVGTGPDEVGPEHIYQLMREQNDGLERLHQAIAGDDSDTLTGQIRLLRQNQDDNHKAVAKEAERQAEAAETLNRQAEDQRATFDTFAQNLSTQLHDFAEMMSKSATEQVINALKEVIQDFNNQLTEQFGENFKALDASVKSLVEWQENYRQQLGEMSDQYAQGVTAITQTETSLSHISDSAASIPDAMSGLEPLLATTQRQLDDLESHLGAFRDMRDRAVEAVPEIRRQVEDTVSDISHAAQHAAQDLAAGSQSMKETLEESATGLQEGNRQLQEEYTKAIEGAQNQVQELMTRVVDEHHKMTGTMSEASDKTQEQLRQAQSQTSDALESLQSQYQRSLEEAGQQYQTLLSNAYQQVEAAMQQAVTRTGEHVNAQMERIDESMQQELQRVMTEMGSALGQISGRFTQDYQKLTTEMQQVVQSANSGAY